MELEAVESVERGQEPAVPAAHLDLVGLGGALGEARDREGTARQLRGDRRLHVVPLLRAARREDLLGLAAQEEPPEVDVMHGHLVQDPTAEGPAPPPLGVGRPLPSSTTPDRSNELDTPCE